MSSDSEYDSSVPQTEQDLISLVMKMQQQLNAVEKKLDALMVQLEEKNNASGNTYSKPFRPYGRDQRHGGGDGRRDRGPRDRNFGGRSFDRNDRGQGEGRRDFGGDRNFGQGRSFDRNDRPQGGGGFGRKKPFFKRRRDRD